MKALALVAIVCTLPACTASQRYVVSGETLDVAGRQFIAVGDAMNAGLDAGKVDGDTYRDWAVFAQKFDLFYGQSIDAWKLAQSIEDKVAERRYADALAELMLELAKFYNDLKAAGLLPIGAP